MMGNHGPVRQQSVVNPDAIAVMAGDLFWTYTTLERRVQIMAAGLADLGIKPGEVLVAAGGNSPMLLVLIFACIRSGIIILPVNPGLPEAGLNSILQQTGAHAFWRENPELCANWEGINLPVNLAHVKGEVREFEWDAERICNLVMTSGSSGSPKAVAHSFSCHQASADASRSIIPLVPGDGWLLSLPLYHIGGLAILFRCVLAGARIVFPDHRRQLAQTLVRRHITHVSLVNTQLYRLLQKDGFRFQSSPVKTVLVGGGYVSAELAATCKEQGVRLLTTYGMTETSSQVCTGEPVFLDRGALTSGYCLPHAELRINDQGSICFRGPSLFKGYWKQGKLTRSFTDDGWFVTGDRGCWYDNQLQVAGRCDSQFISGGENIQPEAIERALLELTYISRVLVVPIHSWEFGQRPVAIVDCGPESFDPSLWSQHLRKQIPGFMVPDHYLPWPAEQGPAALKVSRKTMTKYAEQKCSCAQPDQPGQEKILNY